MGAVFGSLGALSIGLSDLFGRRVVVASSALTAAAVMQFVAIFTSVIAVGVEDSRFQAADLGLGALSGVGLGVGLSCYYAGLVRSSSAVVAPLVATLAAVIPFVYTALTDEPPAALAWIGAVVAAGGLVLITFGGEQIERVRAGLIWGTVSGVGYGTGTAALVDVSTTAGQWPAVTQRLAAFVLLSVAAVVLSQPLTPPRGVRVSAVLAGALAGLTTLFIIFGVAHNARATVVTVSMFPAASVTVGWLFFRDSVTRTQLLGIATALIGVAVVIAV